MAHPLFLCHSDVLLPFLSSHSCLCWVWLVLWGEEELESTAACNLEQLRYTFGTVTLFHCLDTNQLVSQNRKVRYLHRKAESRASGFHARKRHAWHDITWHGVTRFCSRRKKLKTWRKPMEQGFNQKHMMPRSRVQLIFSPLLPYCTQTTSLNDFCCTLHLTRVFLTTKPNRRSCMRILWIDMYMYCIGSTQYVVLIQN